MDNKNEIINSVLSAMTAHLDTGKLQILNDVLIRLLENVEIISKKNNMATTYDINSEIIELFKLKKSGKLASGTMNQYIRHITLLTEFINKPLSLINENDIEYFLLIYKNKGNSNCTVNNCKRYLSAFFTWLRKSRMICENPVENIDNLKQTSKPIEHLEPEQWEQLKDGCRDTRDRALIEFMRSTAARNGEIPLIQISDIDWAEGKLTIYGQKSDKYRLVCIDRVAKKYLIKYIKERGLDLNSKNPLFVSKTKREVPISKSGIYYTVKNIAKKSNIQINVYPHLLRKTTATNIIKRGGSSEEASEYLGHAEKNTASRHYIYKGEEHLMEIFRKRVAAI